MFLVLGLALALMSYIFVAGMVTTKVRAISKANCTRDHLHSYSRVDKCNKPSWHDDEGYPTGIAWPLALPFIAGRLMADGDARRDNKAEREKRAAEQRIEQANLTRKAIEQERRNLQNSIDNLELEARIGR